MKIILTLFLLAISSFSLSDSDLDCDNEQVREEKPAECIFLDSNEIEEELNNYYSTLILDLKLAAKNEDKNPPFGVSVKDAIPRIEKSQKAWLDLLKIDCDLYSSNVSTAGGQVSAPMYYECKIKASTERLKLLESFRDGWLQ